MNNLSSKYRPFFSVIVPAYNSAEYIEKCIKSVLEQTCVDFELILVDDGSKDTTFDVCSTYAKRDFRIKAIHKENGGHTSARNEGLKASVGKYILFLDSDDWLGVKTLEACKAEIFSKNSDIVIFDMKNASTRLSFPLLVEDGYYDLSAPKGNLLERILMDENGNFVFPRSLSAKCFKKEIIFNGQLSVPREVLVGEDGASFVAATLEAKGISVIASNDSACYNCMVRLGSVSHSADSKAFQRLPFLFEYYKKIFSVNQFDFSKQFDRYIVAQLYTAALLVIRSGGGRKELNRELDNVLKDSFICTALRKARFNLKGYKFCIKQIILRCRMWKLVKLLDKRG